MSDYQGGTYIMPHSRKEWFEHTFPNAQTWDYNDFHTHYRLGAVDIYIINHMRGGEVIFLPPGTQASFLMEVPHE